MPQHVVVRTQHLISLHYFQHTQQQPPPPALLTPHLFVTQVCWQSGHTDAGCRGLIHQAAHHLEQRQVDVGRGLCRAQGAGGCGVVVVRPPNAKHLTLLL